jgi:hypothetical protein
MRIPSSLSASGSGLLREHRVHGEMLSDVTHELDCTERRQIVRVVHELRRILRDIEVETKKLRSNAPARSPRRGESGGAAARRSPLDRQ